MAKFLDYEGLQAVVNYLTPQAGEGISITKNSNKQNVISCTLDTTVFKIVTSLPTSDIDTNVIYVVTGTTTGEGDNLFSEYIYVDGTWEKLGEFKADTDLSDYYTKEEVDSLINTDLSNYYTKSEVDALIAAAQLAIDNEEAEIQEILSTMLTKSEAASTYQEILSAGDGISLSDNTVSLNLSASATGDDNLTLSASVNGGNLTITGSVDLSDYLTATEVADIYQEILTPGNLIKIEDNVISADLEAITTDEIDALFA